MKVVYIVDGLLFLVLIGPDAHVPSLILVCAHVFAQRCRLLKGAVAVGAAAGPLSSVNELVVLKVLQSTQAFPTDAADVRLLAGVRTAMFAQTVQMAEAVSALRARVGFLACVDAQVCFKSSGFTETSAANATGIRLFPSVDANVLFQTRDEAESLPTLNTVVRPIGSGPRCSPHP